MSQQDARGKSLPDKRKPLAGRGRKATGQAEAWQAGLPNEKDAVLLGKEDLLFQTRYK